MFPLMLNLSGRLAVVVGGGPVGRHKAKTLRESGAGVRVVSLGPRPDDAPADLDWRAEAYHPGHLEGASLAVAAATPEANRRVVADARARGVWVSDAIDPAAGDFVFPAVFRRGPLTVAVSTGGAAPGVARAVRDQLESQFDEAFGEWLVLLAELRSVVLARVAPEQRRELFACLSAWHWLDRLRREGVAAVRTAMWDEMEARVAAQPRPGTSP